MHPRVSFIVPCYRLAHLLPECVGSILSQTYGDFEVLIMDDCSPDQTPEVAQSFGDPRVRHIRNESNLGHLRNYNKGIDLARGQYVWLISADDRLRQPYVLRRYIDLFSAHPEVGYAFCPGVGVEKGEETGLLKWSWWGARDAIFKGPGFLYTLLPRSGGIVASSVMARKQCYLEAGKFPLDMPHQGDLYLWSRWALRYHIAYFAEPMVNYRVDEFSMLRRFEREAPRTVIDDALAVLWRTKRQAQQAGFASLAARCDHFIAQKYLEFVVPTIYKDKAAKCTLSLRDCEESLTQNARGAGEETVLRARVYAGLGDEHYWHGDFASALRFYARGLKQCPWMLKIWAKYFLLLTGEVGIGLRSSLP